MEEGRCSSQKSCKQKIDEDIGTSKGKQSKSPDSKSKAKSPKSKSKSPKITKKAGSPKSKSPKTDKGKQSKSQAGCSFRLWAGWMQNESTFQIKTLIPNHTCSRNCDLGSLVTYKWLAKQFAHEVVRNPKISYRQMKADAKENFRINVSVGMCKRAKQREVYDHEGGLVDHYARLWDYREQILITNPGSSVHLDVDTRDDGKTVLKGIMLYNCIGILSHLCIVCCLTLIYSIAMKEG